MAKGNVTNNDVLEMILKGVDPAWRSSASMVWIALHKTDPTAAGNQSSNEADYSNYARVGVPKATGWTDNGTNFTNAAQIAFNQCGVTGNTINFVSIGSASPVGSAGQIFYSGQLNSQLAVANLIQPQFSINALTITES
jgi:hypothetical protein